MRTGLEVAPWTGTGLSADVNGEVTDDAFLKASNQAKEDAVATAEAIGYPVVLKASQGGGGK